MTSRWIFYSAPGTCALATHIALCEADADFELVQLDFGRQQQRGADYLAINPKGRVPALATKHGVLTETPALLAFVAQRFPQARLAPLDDAFAFARMQEMTSYLASTMHVAHAHKRRGARWADDPASHADMARKVPQTMAACAAHIEQQLTGDWVLGDHYSVADGYLFTICTWLAGDDVNLADYPRLTAHHARTGQRPAVQRALAESAVAKP